MPGMADPDELDEMLAALGMVPVLLDQDGRVIAWGDPPVSADKPPARPPRTRDQASSGSIRYLARVVER